MTIKRCPGAMAFSQPKIEMTPCPDCGADVEIWSDEATGQCPKCSRTVIRTATQSCVDWCRYAKECLGEDKFKKYGQMKTALTKTTSSSCTTPCCLPLPRASARGQGAPRFPEN